MTVPTPVGFLDFFVLEASDYIEQLDAQLLAGGAGEPDAEALQRVARALRGSATMAKLAAFAEMASGIERVGRALRERTVAWEPGLRGALVATVDDCKLLLRNVRAWGAADDARAGARVDEITRFVPARAATPITSPATAGHDSYLATESANIGAGLELLATRPMDREAAGNVLGRVRALRGIASVKDHAALADVLEAAEQAAHPLELGEPVLNAERVALLAAAAPLLRGIAAAMRTGATVDAASPDIARFAAALDAMQQRESGTERVVPIADLFYQDGGLTVVETAANPPTSPAERFRLEVVSQGEHLRRLVGDARSARDELARERVRRGLRQALKSLRQAAESFGEQDVADFVASHNDAVVRLDTRALESLEEGATLLAQPGGVAGVRRASRRRHGSDADGGACGTSCDSRDPFARGTFAAPSSLRHAERDDDAHQGRADHLGTARAAAPRRAPADSSGIGRGGRDAEPDPRRRRRGAGRPAGPWDPQSGHPAADSAQQPGNARGAAAGADRRPALSREGGARAGAGDPRRLAAQRRRGRRGSPGRAVRPARPGAHRLNGRVR